MLCSECLIDRRGRGTASNMKWVEKPSNVNFMDAGKVVEVPISLIYYSKLRHLICIEIPPPVHSLPIFCVIWLQVGKGRGKKKKNACGQWNYLTTSARSLRLMWASTQSCPQQSQSVTSLLLFPPFISLSPSLPLDIFISSLFPALPLCHIASSMLEKYCSTWENHWVSTGIYESHNEFRPRVKMLRQVREPLVI